MSTYKVKTTDLIHYQPKMRTIQKENNQPEFGLDMNSSQPLRRSIPCGVKIRTIKESFAMELITVVCGKDNERLGSTQLCHACYAAFKDLSSKATETPKLPKIPQMTEARISMEQTENYLDSNPLSFLEKCKRFAQNHPFLAAVTVAFPVICGMVAYGISNAKAAHTENEMPLGLEPSLIPTTMLPSASTQATALTTEPTTGPTTQPTTETTTKKAMPTKSQEPHIPNYSVEIKQASALKDRDTVIVTTRVAMPKAQSKNSCFTSTSFYYWHENAPDDSGVKMTNNCSRPLLITTTKKTDKDKIVATGKPCIVEHGETKLCLGPPERLTGYFGGNIKFEVSLAEDANQSIKAKVTEQGDVTITLSNSGQASQDLRCIKVQSHDGNAVCTNTCDEPILLSIMGSEGVESIFMQPKDSQTLTLSQLPNLRENANLPEVIQKPEFV